MANLFAITIPDSAAALLVTYGAGALIRVQSSPTVGGVYGEVVTIPIVSGQSAYPVYDADGEAGYSYKYRYEASDGDPAGSYSVAFQPSASQGIYATLTELKRFARIDDTVDDAELEVALAAASRVIDRTCRRQFGHVAATETRYFTAYWSRERSRYVVDIDDLYDADGVTVTSDVTAITTYTLEPRNAPSRDQPYTRILFASGAVVSTQPDLIALESGSFGWESVPLTIKQATLLQASRIFKRRDAPFGVAGSPDMGNELRLLAQVDPDVAVMLKPYYRWWGAR
jgi:hypothetical protein